MSYNVGKGTHITGFVFGILSIASIAAAIVMATQVNMSGGFYVGAVMVFLLGLVFGLIGRAVCRSAKLKNPHIAWGKVGLVFSWMGIVCTVGVIIPAILVVRAALRRA